VSLPPDPLSEYGTAAYGSGNYADYVPPYSPPPAPPPYEDLPLVSPGPAPQTTYRWLTFDWVTGQWLGELQPASWDLERILSGAGAGSVEVGLPHDAVQARAMLNITQPRRTGLYVERDGLPLWGGMIWSRPWSERALDTITLEAAECWSYFRRRYIRHLLAWATATEQFAIVRDLIRYAQGDAPESATWRYDQPGSASAGVGFSAQASGVTRVVTYTGNVAPKNVAEAVEEMCDNDNGFDFTIEVGRDTDGSLRRELALWHPTRRRQAVLTGWRADLGANLIAVNVPDDIGAEATRVIGTNDMGENKVLRATATATALLDAGYPVLEESLTARNVTVQATLQAKVNQALAHWAQGDGINSVRINPHSPLMPVGAFDLGDEVEVVVPALSSYDAGPVSARFPYGLRQTRRIVAWKLTGDDSGESCEVRFEDAEPPVLDEEEG
jgi:hypothetical protein